MGFIAIFIKSDLRIPSEVAKFLSIYLLFNIGLRGGQELAAQGLSLLSFKMIGICVLFSALSPIIFFFVLRKKLDVFNSGAIAATYGSFSLVTFATAIAYIEDLGISYGGYMVAGMAFMEVFAIVSGLLLIRLNDGDKSSNSLLKVIKDSLSSGSVFLLLGSFLIGFLTAEHGTAQLKPFVYDIFKGMLCLYMLDMGLFAGERLNKIRGSSAKFLIYIALIFPIASASCALLVAFLLNFSVGDAFLLCVLCSSASYIAVPAAMRMNVPKANIGMVIPLTLGITFPYNIIIAIPVYFAIIERLWL